MLFKFFDPAIFGKLRFGGQQTVFSSAERLALVYDVVFIFSSYS